MCKGHRFAKHTAMHRTAPDNELLSLKMSLELSLRNPDQELSLSCPVFQKRLFLPWVLAARFLLLGSVRMRLGQELRRQEEEGGAFASLLVPCSRIRCLAVTPSLCDGTPFRQPRGH